MKHMVMDTNGLPLGFYDEEINSNIPDEAIEITDEQWQEFLNNQGKRRWDGTKVVEYIKVYTDEELAEQVRAKRDSLLRDFDLNIFCNPLHWEEYTPEQQNILTGYRQALKDIPNQSGFPSEVAFPEKPEL